VGFAGLLDDPPECIHDGFRRYTERWEETVKIVECWCETCSTQLYEMRTNVVKAPVETHTLYLDPILEA
jgi:hypothetical protein